MRLLWLWSLSLCLIAITQATTQKEGTWRYDRRSRHCVLGNGESMLRLRRVVLRHRDQKCTFKQCTTKGLVTYIRRNKPYEACWDHLAKRCRRLSSKFKFTNPATNECGILRCTPMTSLEEVYIACYDSKRKNCAKREEEREFFNANGECAVRRCVQVDPIRYAWSEKLMDCQEKEKTTEPQ